MRSAQYPTAAASDGASSGNGKRIRLLPPAIAHLAEEGYRPYIVLDDWEEVPFRQRFTDQSPLASLDWVPLAALEGGRVRIYDPIERYPGPKHKPLIGNSRGLGHGLPWAARFAVREARFVVGSNGKHRRAPYLNAPAPDSTRRGDNDSWLMVATAA